MKQPFTVCTALAFAALSLAGCADRNKDNIPDDTATKTEINKVVKKAEEKTSKTLTKAGDEAEVALTNSSVTSKIKMAYFQDPDLKASRINIDTISQRKTVVLRGTVGNAQQKQRATNIARNHAPAGFKVVNQLVVPGKSKAR